MVSADECIIVWGYRCSTLGSCLVALKGISWLIIFAGYAIVFPGFLGGVLFAMNAETTMDELEIK